MAWLLLVVVVVLALVVIKDERKGEGSGGWRLVSLSG